MRRTRSLGPAALLPLLVACAVGESSPPPGEAPGVAVAPWEVTTTSEAARRYSAAADYFWDSGRTLEANEQYKRAVAADPTFAYAYLGVAGTAADLGRALEYKWNLDRAVEAAAGASRTEQLLVQIVQRRFDRDMEGVLEAAQELVALHPEHPRAWMEVGWAQASLGRVEEYRRALQRAIDLQPDLALAHALLGESYFQSQPRDLETAERHILRAVELAPEPLTMDYLGDLRRAQGRLEEARDAYTRQLELYPQDALALIQRGHVYSFLGDFERARADYAAAVARARGNQRSGAAMYHAIVHTYAGNPAAAVAELGELYRAIDGMGMADPVLSKTGVLNAQLVTALHIGDLATGERAVAELDSIWADLWSGVDTDAARRAEQAGRVERAARLAFRRGDLPAARRLAREYMRVVEPERNPTKNRPAHEILGFVELTAGNPGEAVTHFQQANPNDIYLVYHHGLALEALGRRDEARAMFDRVANYYFNNPGPALVRAAAAEKLR